MSPATRDTSDTSDTLFDGAVRLAQPARGLGYRVNVDALWLARFAAEGRGAARAWDLGAGVGAVGLALLHTGAAEQVVLVERDREAARLAATNLTANGWTARGRVVEGDVKDVEDVGVADLIVCNPPYTAPGRGRAGAVPARHAAREGELGVFVAAARRVLARRGRACFVYPAPELVTLLGLLREHGLEPKRLRFVHAHEDAASRVVLVEAKAAKSGGLVVLPPWFDSAGDPARMGVPPVGGLSNV